LYSRTLNWIPLPESGHLIPTQYGNVPSRIIYCGGQVDVTFAILRVFIGETDYAPIF